MNAKEEYLRFVSGKAPVKCAVILVEDDDYDKIPKTSLPIGHTKEALNSFLSDLNYEYDSGFGGQELFGTIWFTDGTWADRGEYDGSEWWEYQKCPAVPNELTGESK